jgi:hypothetical protein
MEYVPRMRKKKSILFVRPDFHCSYFYRDELRRQGWKADIFVNPSYPDELLYSKEGILRAPQLSGLGLAERPVRFLNHTLLLLWYLAHFWRYEYHVYYGKPPAFSLFEGLLGFGSDGLLELRLAKRFGVKLVFVPTGCLETETKRNFTALDNGNVCGNCGFWDRCDDRLNERHFRRVRKYIDIAIGTGELDSSQYQANHIKYKAIDLDLWSPDAAVPTEHRLPATNNIRVLHSSYLKNSGRNPGERNIKGSRYILAAIERMREEGYPVEYCFIEDKPSNQMRFYQAQADIVVE